VKEKATNLVSKTGYEGKCKTFSLKYKFFVCFKQFDIISKNGRYSVLSHHWKRIWLVVMLVILESCTVSGLVTIFAQFLHFVTCLRLVKFDSFPAVKVHIVI
jgi:hypothetical protein